MAITAKYSPVLRWWLFFTVISLGVFTLAVSGALREIIRVDVTKISILILAVFFFFTIRTGRNTFRLCNGNGAAAYSATGDRDDELGWFVSDMLLTMGMIGTVIGFIYMLGTSFVEFDPANADSLRNVLSRMSGGMSTALYTTAAGLICSLLLKLQLFNFTQHLNAARPNLSEE
jgi:hypothetical protein